MSPRRILAAALAVAATAGAVAAARGLAAAMREAGELLDNLIDFDDDDEADGIAASHQTPRREAAGR